MDRRQLMARSAQAALALAALGLLPGRSAAQAAAWNAAAFDARSLADLMKALGSSAPVPSREVTLTAPDIAENGALVQLGASTTLAGCRRLVVAVEGNPAVLSAVFELSDAVEPNVVLQVKMSQSSHVHAIALLADGRVFHAFKEVKITVGGCG